MKKKNSNNEINTEVVNNEVEEVKENKGKKGITINSVNKKALGQIGAIAIMVGVVVGTVMCCTSSEKESKNASKPNKKMEASSNNKPLTNNTKKEESVVVNNTNKEETNFTKTETKEEVSEVVNEVVEKETKEEELLAEIEAERNAQFVSYDEYYNTYLKFFKKYKDLLNVKSTDAIVYYMNYGLLNDETKEDIVGKFVVNNRNDVNNDLVIAFGDFVNYNINVYKERISKPTIVKETLKLSDAAAKSEHKQTFEYFDSLIDIMATGSQEDAINAYYELHNTLIYLDADVKNETEDATEKYDRIGYNELTAGEQQISKMYYCIMAPQIMNERIRIEQFNFTKEEEKDWQTTWKYDSESNTAIKSTIADDFSLAAADTINTLYNASDCIVLVKKQ